MRLRQLKIRGLGRLHETEWIALSSTITLFRFPDKSVGREFLETVQSLNPPYECRTDQPFKDIPLETFSANGHRRVIAPEKRTIVFAIFDTPSSLVRELGAITPPLYETDRVEIGRRLDYSRWINFVEIASSSRWSEMSEDIRTLLRHQSPEGAEYSNIHRLLAETAPTDRIKGAMAEQLATWLTDLRSHQPNHKGFDQTLEKILRASRFSEARRLIATRLPLFISLQFGEELQRFAVSETTGNETDTSPILMIDCLNSKLPDEVDKKISAQVFSLAERYQCLCFTDHSHSGWNFPEKQFVDVDVLNLA